MDAINALSPMTVVGISGIIPVGLVYAQVLVPDASASKPVTTTILGSVGAGIGAGSAYLLINYANMNNRIVVLAASVGAAYLGANAVAAMLPSSS